MAPLKRSPAKILRRYFVQAGLMFDPANPLVDWTAYSNNLGDMPDNAVVFTDVDGMVYGRNFRTGATLTSPGVQLLVRGQDQDYSWNRADIYARVLDSIFRQVVRIGSDDFFIQSVSRIGDVIPLGLERQEKELARSRFIFTINSVMTFSALSESVLTIPAVTVPGTPDFWKSHTISGTIDGINRNFTIPSVLPGTTIAYMLRKNGRILLKGLTGDYVLSGVDITFNTGKAPSIDDTLSLTYIDQG